MKLNILVILVSLMYSLNIKGQIFQTDLNKKKITSVSFKLANSNITVTGSEDDSLTITVSGGEHTNLKDSSGLGLQLTTTGHTLALEKTTSKDITYLVKLPKYISLSVEETLDKPHLLTIQNMQGDVSVNSWVSTIKLINNTGAVTANSYASDIFAILPTNINRPCSFVSLGRLVELTINQKSKIVLEAKVMAKRFTTNYKTSTPFEIKQSGFFQTIKGSMNGGGAMVKVESNLLVINE
jgi:hypothetical protein